MRFLAASLAYLSAAKAQECRTVLSDMRLKALSQAQGTSSNPDDWNDLSGLRRKTCIPSERPSCAY